MATPSQLFLINKIIFKPKSSFAIEWETHWAEMRGPQHYSNMHKYEFLINLFIINMNKYEFIITLLNQIFYT